MVDSSKKVPDLNCEVQDLLLEVVDLKQEVPDLRSDGIPLNLTPAFLLALLCDFVLALCLKCFSAFFIGHYCLPSRVECAFSCLCV